MGIRHDVEQNLKKYKITKIDGQPIDEDLNLLTKELTNAAGSVATLNGGGEHGHVGMVQRTQARIQQPLTRTKSSVNVNLRNTRRNATSTKLTLESRTTFAG